MKASELQSLKIKKAVTLSEKKTSKTVKSLKQLKIST